MVQIPPEVIQINTTHGTRFRLPRSLVKAKGCGAFIIMMVFGMGFGGMATAFFATMMYSFFFQGEPEWYFVLGVSVFLIPFFAIGYGFMLAAVYSMFGYCEIEVTDYEFIGIKKLGPLYWRTRWTADQIRDLRAVPNGERFSDEFVINVETEDGKTGHVGTDYPANVLRAIAAYARTELRIAGAADGVRIDDPNGPGVRAISSLELLGSAAEPRQSNVELKRASGQLGTIAWVIIAILWNAIAWGATIAMWADGERIMGSIIGVIFIGAGIAFAVAAIKSFLAGMSFQPPQITLSSSPVMVGESVSGSFLQMAKGNATVNSVELKLICRESATYKRGTDTTTVTHDALTIPYRILDTQTTISGSPLRADFDIQIPDDAMHTFEASRNSVQWILEAHTDIESWPDMTLAFEIPVCPRSMAQQSTS